MKKNYEMIKKQASDKEKRQKHTKTTKEEIGNLPEKEFRMMV